MKLFAILWSVPLIATAFVMACDRGTAFLASESRSVSRRNRQVISDCNQKIHPIGSNAFAYAGGQVHASDLAIESFRRAASSSSAENIERLCDQVEESFFRTLRSIAVKLHASGDDVLLGYGLIGYREGKAAWMARNITIATAAAQDKGAIGRCNSWDFVAPNWYVAAHDAALSFGLNPLTWQRGALSAIQAILDLESRTTWESGGPIVIASVDARGARWVQGPVDTRIGGGIWG